MRKMYKNDRPGGGVEIRDWLVEIYCSAERFKKFTGNYCIPVRLKIDAFEIGVRSGIFKIQHSGHRANYSNAFIYAVDSVVGDGLMTLMSYR